MALWPIIVLYVVIGVVAGVGSVTISSRRFHGRTEQVFYGLLLVPIALMYLAFSAHFTAADAWRLEALGALVFVALGLLGTRVLPLLILGYVAHGAWDLVHELAWQPDTLGDGAPSLTPIPLAYGAFCGVYDCFMAGYFYTRREAWRNAWKGS